MRNRSTTDRFGQDRNDPWLAEAVLEFATIAGLFAMLFGVFFLLRALEELPV